MSRPTNEQLATAAREGDRGAFRELVMRLEPRVAATVTGMLGRGPDAEDVGQEVFIRFYKALKSFRGESSVVTYVTRIAIKLAHNELARRKRWWSRFADDASESLEDVPDPRGQDLAYEDKATLHWGLDQMKPHYRAVVVLRLLQGFSTEETAEILKIPPGTVTSRLARGQMQLREILAPHFGEGK